jgi:epoxide hydrolase-like predicted phosphatase
MIKAFLFDNGGVMTAGGAGNELSERLAAHLDITLKQAWNLLQPVQNDYIKAQITEPELWLSIEKQYGKSITVAQRDIWNKWADMRPLPEMVQLVQRLKKDGYTVGLLSNVIPNTEREIREHGGYAIFDFLILSCMVGYAKPQPEIYAMALKHLTSIEPSEVVFLDDQERCLEPARKLGIKTILVTSAPQAISAVNKLTQSR